MNCPMCSGNSRFFVNQNFLRLSSNKDTVKFNGIMKYYKCDNCELIFCPEMMNWSKEKLSELCYNDYYKNYDMDTVLPNGNRTIMSFDYIKEKFSPCKHLDYGGGIGNLSVMINRFGFNSSCYDPFTKYNDTKLLSKRYGLVSCIEVLEHSYNFIDVARDITSCSDNIYISTGLSDGVVDFNNWYYFNPRVGHMIIFSRKAIEILFDKFGFKIVDITNQHKEQKNILLMKKIR